MAGRVLHFVVAGAAILAGMVIQGDIDVGHNPDKHVHRKLDRIIDLRSERVEIQTGETQGQVDSKTELALTAAVTELVRAEGSLIAVKLDDKAPAEMIEQVEHRRDVARDAVERVADEAKAQAHGNRDAIHKVRDEVRDALRS